MFVVEEDGVLVFCAAALFGCCGLAAPPPPPPPPFVAGGALPGFFGLDVEATRVPVLFPLMLNIPPQRTKSMDQLVNLVELYQQLLK